MAIWGTLRIIAQKMMEWYYATTASKMGIIRGSARMIQSMSPLRPGQEKDPTLKIIKDPINVAAGISVEVVALEAEATEALEEGVLEEGSEDLLEEVEEEIEVVLTIMDTTVEMEEEVDLEVVEEVEEVVEEDMEIKEIGIMLMLPLHKISLK